MKNTFMATVINTFTKETTEHNNVTSVVSNLGGVLISTADQGQFQYDDQHVVGIHHLN